MGEKKGKATGMQQRHGSCRDTDIEPGDAHDSTQPSRLEVRQPAHRRQPIEHPEYSTRDEKDRE